MKKASNMQVKIFELTRLLMIRGKIIPRCFPKKVNLWYIEDANAEYGGMGGFFPNLEGKLEAGIIINLSVNYTLEYLTAVYAHEILHIQQYREFKDVNHGNKFRKDCKKIALILGCSYYLVNGYDRPNDLTAYYMGKRYAKWLLTFGNKK